MKIELPVFAEKSELFAYLKKHERDILALKKGALKYCDVFGGSAFERNYTQSVTKAHKDTRSTDTEDVIRKTIVGNTYNWLDSHDDVHIEGIFTKSIQDNKDRILHLHDHLQQVGAKVGIPCDIYEEKTKWTDLGVNKPGETICLCMDSDIKKYLNESIFNQYKNREIDQHSVGMIYVNLFLCLDSKEPQYKEDFANWQKYIAKLGNPEKAQEQGYFFAVTAAKLKEISAVTEGSNELTPTKYFEAAENTSDKSAPGNSTLNKNAAIWRELNNLLKS